MSLSRRTFSLSYSPSDGEVRLPAQIRERWLTPDVSHAVVQATGDRVSIWLWSDRDDIRVDLPVTDFTTSRGFTRKLHRWGVNVNRWSDVLVVEGSDEPTVEATVDTIDIEGPSHE